MKNTINFAPWHIQGQANVEKHLLNGSSYYTGWRVNKDGTVNVSSQNYAPISALKDDKLILKYRRTKNFTIISTTLTNLWGCPDSVDGDLTINCSKLSSLDNLTYEVEEKISIACPKLDTFSQKTSFCNVLQLIDVGEFDLTKRWNEVNIYPISYVSLGIKEVYKLINKPLLGLCLLRNKLKTDIIISENAKNAMQHPTQFKEEHFQILQAFNIINSHTDILECQEELILAGLKHYAKIK